MSQLADVLAEINQRYDLGLALRSRFAAGLQGGAWLVVDRDDRSAVLKTWPSGSAERLGSVAAAVTTARAAGYPTPRWLAAGVTRAGFGYYVQEFVAGEPATPLTRENIGPLLAVLELQAGLAPTGVPDSNAAIRRSALDGAPRSTANRIDPSLVEHFDRLITDAPGPLHTDLVHGDFNSCNVLLGAGLDVRAVIDVDGLGRGTRVVDYACLLREVYVEGYDPMVAHEIRRAAELIAGPAALALCTAAAAFWIVGFKQEHEPHRLTEILASLHQLATDLETH